MKQYIKNDTIKNANRITVIVNGMQIINPTEEQILKDGWKVYEAPKPEPQEPQLEPSSYAMNMAVVAMMIPQAKAAFKKLEDQKALAVKELADTWVSKIGVPVNVGDRLWYNNYLIKVRQAHTPQLDWKPSKDTSSLYEQVFDDHAGIEEDPIPYNEVHDPDFLGMALVKGKIYRQDNELWECIEDTINPVYDDFSDGTLVRYVKRYEKV